MILSPNPRHPHRGSMHHTEFDEEKRKFKIRLEERLRAKGCNCRIVKVRKAAEAAMHTGLDIIQRLINQISPSPFNRKAPFGLVTYVQLVELQDTIALEAKKTLDSIETDNGPTTCMDDRMSLLTVRKLGEARDRACQVIHDQLKSAYGGGQPSS